MFLSSRSSFPNIAACKVTLEDVKDLNLKLLIYKADRSSSINMVSCLSSENVVDDVVYNLEGVVNYDTIQCTVLEREYERSIDNKDSTVFCFPHGMVIDDACSKAWLKDSVQATRKNLLLNHKRPTVDRRFYCDTTRKIICKPLESIVRHALEIAKCQKIGASSTDNNGADDVFVYCNKYLRFLEYKTVGGELLPHRDGIKTCEDTGIKSTHTLLLFLSDCEFGGETLIMDDRPNVNDDSGNWSKETNLVLDVYDNPDCNPSDDNQQSDPSNRKMFNKRRIRYNPNDIGEETKSKIKVFRLQDATLRKIDSSVDEESCQGDGEIFPPPRHISVGIQPTEGRVLLFPHDWPHAGAMCQSVPKIALRAEITIVQT